jgi:hypothetical protein
MVSGAKQYGVYQVKLQDNRSKKSTTPEFKDVFEKVDCIRNFKKRKKYTGKSTTISHFTALLLLQKQINYS